MEYRQLGHSGLKVSALTLGTMTFGGQGKFAQVGNTNLEQAKKQIGLCMDAGINLYDTADIYSDGLSEEILGAAVSNIRNDILIATKLRFPTGSGPNQGGASRYHIIKACEASLKRLNTDYIDLYQIHEWDGITPVDETLEAMDTLVRSGKIRYYGVSNYTGWQLMKTLGESALHHYLRPISQQIHYSLQAREAEYELLPIAQDQNVGVLIWSPLAGGLLSGKYQRNKEGPSDARHLQGWQEPPVYDTEKLYDIIDVLLDISEQRGISPAQIALAWLLSRAPVSSVVIGARTEAQLKDNLNACNVSLTGEELLRLDKVSRPPLLYPYWHQASTAEDRLSEIDKALLNPYIDDRD
ncbi:aldo/keto reductase [Vibrio viridaestus]|uniref:Aldo/keto reductase n=1 Tax=Vibrio viridaestus TaxID=2487322 RepID=A0A3N9TGE1_9VIBR|nr:aldo/keto reductase [Vibrio viridaestus]RQW62545.1 aldo/keto reductase [Vibrio viridaestus]